MKARYPDPAARAASTVASPVRAPAAQAGVVPFTPPAQAPVAPAAVSPVALGRSAVAAVDRLAAASRLVLGRSAVGGMAVTRAGPSAVDPSGVAVDPSAAVAAAVTRAGRPAAGPSAAVGPSAALAAVGPLAALAAAGTAVAALAAAAASVVAAASAAAATGALVAAVGAATAVAAATGSQPLTAGCRSSVATRLKQHVWCYGTQGDAGTVEHRPVKNPGELERWWASYLAFLWRHRRSAWCWSKVKAPTGSRSTRTTSTWPRTRRPPPHPARCFRPSWGLGKAP